MCQRLEIQAIAERILEQFPVDTENVHVTRTVSPDCTKLVERIRTVRMGQLTIRRESGVSYNPNCTPGDSDQEFSEIVVLQDGTRVLDSTLFKPGPWIEKIIAIDRR